MTDLLTRHVAELDLCTRDDAEGRTVFGIVVPYGAEATVRDAGGPAYLEMFHRGAFAGATDSPDKVALLVNHKWDQMVGRATVLREDAAGLYGEFLVSRTTRGSDLLIDVEDRNVQGFSVGFKPTESIGEPGYDRLVERVKAKLFEVSAVLGDREAYQTTIGKRSEGDDAVVARRTLPERRELSLHPYLR